MDRSQVKYPLRKKHRQAVNKASKTIRNKLTKTIKSLLWMLTKAINFIWHRRFRAFWQLATARYYTAWLRNNAAECGEGVRVNGLLTVTEPRFFTLGNNVHIGARGYFHTNGGLSIGDNTHISRDVTIYTTNHNYQGEALPYDATSRKRPVLIERNCWIGMGVMIRPGITIGEGAIVGIGTVVTRNVAPFEIVGSPSPQHVKYRNKEHYRHLEEQRSYGGVSGKLLAPAQIKSECRNAGDGTNVLFICSTGRSGSQTLARVLNKHPNIAARHEPKFSLIRLSTEFAHGQKSAAQVRQELQALYTHCSTIPTDKQVYVESDQKLSNLAPILSELFPKAKFLWLIRDGRDFVASATARGWFTKEESKLSLQRAIFAEYRLDGPTTDTNLEAATWDAMSVHERNCWYWTYWNHQIQNFQTSLSDTRSRMIRIESLEQEINPLLDWIEVERASLPLAVHNRAVNYVPHHVNHWTTEEHDQFQRQCGKLMDTAYPDWTTTSTPT